MPDNEVTRREFIHDSAMATAGLVVGLTAAARTEAARKTTKPKSQILNYNENMEYQRLGKTELMVSAVCLGGHWKRVNVMNQDFDQNRREVVSRCIDVGINYLDACWGGEVMAYAKALAGRRDKMYLALSNGSKEPRKPEYRTARKMLEGLDELLRASKQEYTDLWRITCLEPGGQHTFNTSCEIVAAFEKAKKQGKARFVGFSTHDRRWIQMMIRQFPQVEVVLFPYTAMSKKAPKGSIFEDLRKCDVGAFGIKPFASNSLFKGDSSPGSPYAEEDDRNARLAIRYILYNSNIIPIPGLISIHQVDNVAKAVMESRKLDLKERADLGRAAEKMWANLPPNYQWLRDWEYV